MVIKAFFQVIRPVIQQCNHRCYIRVIFLAKSERIVRSNAHHVAPCYKSVFFNGIREWVHWLFYMRDLFRSWYIKPRYLDESYRSCYYSEIRKRGVVIVVLFLHEIKIESDQLNHKIIKISSFLLFLDKKKVFIHILTWPDSLYIWSIVSLKFNIVCMSLTNKEFDCITLEYE